jgi:hypothetical protein
MTVPELAVESLLYTSTIDTLLSGTVTGQWAPRAGLCLPQLNLLQGSFGPQPATVPVLGIG